MFAVGTYVCLRASKNTHKGTIAGGAMYQGEMRYIFHLDERITSIAFPDRYVYEQDLEECPRPSDAEIAGMGGDLPGLGSMLASE